jgi:hypothetical protein
MYAANEEFTDITDTGLSNMHPKLIKLKKKIIQCTYSTDNMNWMINIDIKT